MVETNQRFVECSSGLEILVTSINHNSFIGEDAVFFHYLDRPQETRQLAESEFKRLTVPRDPQ